MQFIGTALTAGDALVANFEGLTAFGLTFPDGSTHGTGTLGGTIQERHSITGDATVTGVGYVESNVLTVMALNSDRTQAVLAEFTKQ